MALLRLYGCSKLGKGIYIVANLHTYVYGPTLAEAQDNFFFKKTNE